MARLFEAFIRNFYKLETDYSVSSDTIKWKFTAENAEDLLMLPSMLTDISLIKTGRKIIIDTKYYKEAFNTRFEKQKFDSSNLYQLFAYIKNQETENELTHNCEGILLYPTIHQDFSYSFNYENHKIRIISINLNQAWKAIKEDLIKIIA